MSAVCVCRRYYQPPSAYDRQVRGLTGTPGKPLCVVLPLLLTVVGSSLGLGFGWATGRHWALYAVMGGEQRGRGAVQAPTCVCGEGGDCWCVCPCVCVGGGGGGVCGGGGGGEGQWV